MEPSDKPRVFGNYEILGRLGRGGMAEVYRARVLAGPRAEWTVALKRLLPELAHDPASVELFATEAALSKALEHPNIVQVFDVGVLGDVYFMVMEYVDGRDLGQILRRCRTRKIPLPIDFGVYLGVTLLEALAYAHEARGPEGEALSLVHCDVSPSNLFISRSGEIKLGDFGVARGRTLQRPAGSPTLVAGKPFYMSPEVWAGEVTQQADLWAAAVALYEALTLERPFSGETPEAVRESIRGGRWPGLRELRPDASAELAAVFERAFARDLRLRFASAREFASVLAPLYDERVGTPMGIAGLVRGLFGPQNSRTPPP